jgi:hypothetical protein
MVFGMTGTFGPIELIVIGFEGDTFDGNVSSAMVDLVQRGLVRIIDLALVIKDSVGATHILELEELSPEIAATMAPMTAAVSGLLSEADLSDIAADLRPGTSEAVFLVEHLWATEFANAVRSAGGALLVSERIPGAVVEAARATMKEN